MTDATANVTMVIPGRNVSKTIGQCLEAASPLLAGAHLKEIIFVDDGSTDDTLEIVGRYPVRVVKGPARGPGAARNLGWRAAQTELIWFVDADCVCEPGALDRLMPHMDDPRVAAVSGSYGNMVPESLLACLIHEEIIDRHLRMSNRVDFLATFNVIYRRAVLEAVNGFDERFLKGQDAELSWRVMEAGHLLGFELQSRVKHYHATRWLGYFRTQRLQGYWRLFLHLEHKGHSGGDTYSSLLDHVQPPLAMLILASLPVSLIGAIWLWPILLAPLVLVVGLILTQLPLTLRIVRRTGELKYLAFAWMGFWRAFWRGLGLSQAALAAVLMRLKPDVSTRSADS